MNGIEVGGSIGSGFSQVGQGNVASLAENFKVALLQKEARKLGGILGEVRGLGVAAERSFVGEFVKIEGVLGKIAGGPAKIEGDSSKIATPVKPEGGSLREAAARLKDSLAQNLTVEQRAEVAKELFALKGIKGHFMSKAALDSKLAKYLTQMGIEKSVGLVGADVMEMASGISQGAAIFGKIQPPVVSPDAPGIPGRDCWIPSNERGEELVLPGGDFRRPPMDCTPDMSPERLEERRQRLEEIRQQLEKKTEA